MILYENENNKYQTEVEEKWGNTDAYKEYQEKSRDYSEEELESLRNEFNNIFKLFYECKKQNKSEDSIETQNLVKKLQNHISENIFLCNNEILYGLGQIYVSDNRLKKNIDKNGAGVAQYISDAIKVYCKK